MQRDDEIINRLRDLGPRGIWKNSDEVTRVLEDWEKEQMTEFPIIYFVSKAATYLLLLGVVVFGVKWIGWWPEEWCFGRRQKPGEQDDQVEIVVRTD